LGYALKESDAPLRRVGVRVSQRSGDVELALWTEPGSCNRGFVAGVMRDALKTTSLVRVLSPGPLAQREVRKVEVLEGRGHWREDLGGFRFRISAPSFFQVNTPVAEALVEHVLAELGPNPGCVLDLYSGAGTFTLPLARQMNDVYAVEMQGSSIRDLRRNLSSYDLEAEVCAGDVARVVPELPATDAVVVDPPRTGLSADVRDALLKIAPRVLIYVSCNPATLARDVKEFVAQGHRLEKLRAFDLFPQTHHVEAVATLLRR
jgi:23S rRNA (uracil1939-C5)-methyltransferase